MGIQIATAFGGAGLLALGTLLGAGAVLVARKLQHWREARLAAEWDPY